MPTGDQYVAGQQIYLHTCAPQRHATFVVNNDVLEAPFVVSHKPNAFL